MESKKQFYTQLDKFLSLIKDNGLIAIAYAIEEDERMRLLDFMQSMTREEIILKQKLHAYEADLDLEIVVDAEELDYNIIADGDAVLQTVKIDVKND